MGDRLTLIDAGRDTSPETAIYPYIKALGRDPLEISHILLTHAHWDHCAGAAKIKKDTGCEIGIHLHGKQYLRDPELVERELIKRFPNIPIGTMSNFSSVEATFSFIDGETLNLGGRKIKIIHVPGHSACSCCIVDEAHGIYMAGDSIQGRGVQRPLLFYSVKEYEKSMKKIQNESIEILVNGHPFSPPNRAILKEKQVSKYIKESLIAVDELSNTILQILKDTSRPMRTMQIYEAISYYRPVTIGCMLEALEDKGIVSRKQDENNWIYC